MALKNMIKVGDKVTFGRSGEQKMGGTVIKCNPKTARIKVPREGEFLVTYNLIQKPSSSLRRNPSPSGEAWVMVKGKPVAAKKTAKEPAAAKRKPRQKATGRKICATPVAQRQCAPRTLKKNPPSAREIEEAIRNVTPEWAKEQSTYKLDFLGDSLVKWSSHHLRENVTRGGRINLVDTDLLSRVTAKLNIIINELETRPDWRRGKAKLNPAPKKNPTETLDQELKRLRRELTKARGEAPTEAPAGGLSDRLYQDYVRDREVRIREIEKALPHTLKKNPSGNKPKKAADITDPVRIERTLRGMNSQWISQQSPAELKRHLGELNRMRPSGELFKAVLAKKREVSTAIQRKNKLYADKTLNPADKSMRLVHKGSGRAVEKGEHVIDFRGEEWIIVDWQEPQHQASSGKVYVDDGRGSERSFYPSVFNLEFKPFLFAVNPKPNPANFTAKGERMYEAVKAGYGRDPRAKEIAARTVYKAAQAQTGLVRKKR